MIRALLVLLASFSALAGDEVSLNFHAVPVVDFVEATYKGILSHDYVISPEALVTDKHVSINVKSVSKAKLPALLDGVLAQVDLRSRDVGGVAFIEPVSRVQSSPGSPAISPTPSAPVQPGLVPGSQPGQVFGVSPGALPLPLPDEVEIYHPRYRPAVYLSGVLASLGLQRPTGDAKTALDDVVVLSGTKSVVERSRKLLAQLDTKLASVSIRAAVIEYTASTDDGFSWQSVVSILGSRLSLTLNPGSAAGNVLQLKAGGIDAALSAINGDSHFKLVSEPNIRVTDGGKGRVTVGSDQPVRGAVTYDQRGNPIESIDYRSSGVLLTVEPHVYQDRIAAKVFQQLSDFSSTKTSSIDSPTLLKREIETNVEIDDGELLLLGGLDEDKSSDSKSGVSFLPSLFRTSTSSTNKTQLLVVLEIKKI